MEEAVTTPAVSRVFSFDFCLLSVKFYSYLHGMGCFHLPASLLSISSRTNYVNQSTS
jgi:hypothetical protein